MNNNEVVSILNKLIETCGKGQDTFRNAAENIQNSEFRRLFNIFSQQRGQFISELQGEVHRLRGYTGKKDVSRDLGPNTVSFRSATTTKSPGMRDEASIIAECQRE